MKQRLYIDTSVFGGYFDEQFSEHTKPLFDRLSNNEFIKMNLKNMKSNKKQKKFDAVIYMREQRDKLSDKLSKMTKLEIVEYFKLKALNTNIKPLG